MVYIIGAGPGDPGLITVRGLQCLMTADVVLFDHWVHGRLLRHARAAQVVVTIDATKNGLEASVRDDGQGFDVDAVMGRTLAAQHLGLVGMRERARSIGADLSITSTIGRGAQVSVRLPMLAGQEPFDA